MLYTNLLIYLRCKMSGVSCDVQSSTREYDEPSLMKVPCLSLNRNEMQCMYVDIAITAGSKFCPPVASFVSSLLYFHLHHRQRPSFLSVSFAIMLAWTEPLTNRLYGDRAGRISQHGLHHTTPVNGYRIYQSHDARIESGEAWRLDPDAEPGRESYAANWRNMVSYKTNMILLCAPVQAVRGPTPRKRPGIPSIA